MIRIFQTISNPAVFGATGSLGACVCRVLLQAGIRCSHIGGGRNHERLASMLASSGASTVSFSGTPSPRLRSEMARLEITRTSAGMNALEEAGGAVIVSAGLDGVEPLREAVLSGLPVAVGNKETIVAWGRHIMGPIATKAGGCDIRPVDSEHAAAAVLIRLAAGEGVKKLIITGTGGAVRDIPCDRRSDLPPSRVLSHPVWRMGPKITVDSATLMNKAFEVIEASVLFGIPGSSISVLLDPDAGLHAAVTGVDGQSLAFTGPADMETPVRIALGLEIAPSVRILKGTDADNAISGLKLPDEQGSRAIGLGHAALEAGGTCPMVLAVADEAAVSAFLAGRLRFGDIVPFVEYAFDHFFRMSGRDPESAPDLLATAAEISDFCRRI